MNKKIEKIIVGSAYKLSINNREIFADLVQDGWEIYLHCMAKHGDLPETEFLKIFQTSIRNKNFDRLRKLKVRSIMDLSETPEDYIKSDENLSSEINFVDILASLSDDAKMVAGIATGNTYDRDIKSYLDSAGYTQENICFAIRASWDWSVSRIYKAFTEIRNILR